MEYFPELFILNFRILITNVNEIKGNTILTMCMYVFFVIVGYNDAITSNITIGVAIAETQVELDVYFGCINLKGYGGAGLVRLPLGWKGRPHIYPILSNGTSISAGSMVLTEACADAFTNTSTSSCRTTHPFMLIIMTLCAIIKWASSP